MLCAYVSIVYKFTVSHRKLTLVPTKSVGTLVDSCAIKVTSQMASSLALKRLVSSNLLTKALCRPRNVAPAARIFTTNAVREFDGDDRSLDVDRRSDFDVSRRRDFPLNPFSDVLDAFPGTRNLSQILNAVDQFMDSPLLSASHGWGAGLRRGWDARETEDGLYLRMDMPGLSKEDVKVCLEQNTLVIRGKGTDAESPDDGDERMYSSRINLPEKLYKTDQIKAEMKNGVLKLFLPKLKEDERSDIVHVKVE